jgi:predicted deacetylase
MNKQTIQALPTEDLIHFTELYSATELENAYMDGECSQAEGNRRYKKAIKEFTRYLHRIRMDGDYENDVDFMMEVWELLRQADKELEKRKVN